MKTETIREIPHEIIQRFLFLYAESDVLKRVSLIKTHRYFSFPKK